MARPSISVIIPTRNRRRVLERTFPGYLDLPVEQIVVVDDASSDDTASLCQSFSDERVVVVRHERQQGLPRARNSGITRSTSPLVLMGEDDVIMETSYLDSLRSSLKELNADFVAGRRIAMLRGENTADALCRSENSANDQFTDPAVLWFNDEYCQANPFETPFLHACSLFRRKWAVRFPYDPIYQGNALREETDFYLRCHQAGARMFFCSKAVCFHMFHEYSGGCRGNSCVYAVSGICNNHRFLDRHWQALRQLLDLQSPRWRFETTLALRFARMTLLFWMAARTPRLHAHLKSLAMRGGGQK